jgi:RNA polymerase sporulation-specific sigma factor
MDRTFYEEGRRQQVTGLEQIKEVIYHALLCLGAEQHLHYINGSDKLPPPLSPAEERLALAELLAGKPGARDQLITHNLRLVVYIAKKFETPCTGVEDLISIGTIGLIKAVNTFEPEKNIKLATYASRCIENEILMYLRKSSNRRQDASIDEPLNTDSEGNELLLMDVLTGEQGQVGEELERTAERTALHRAVDQLGCREKQIMELRFGLADGVEHTQKEVADTIGISQSYISRLEKRIIKRLRREMEAKL